jgi:hypothetical protein
MKYIVVTKAWEYNDEYNVIQENGVTIDPQLYDTRQEAEEIGIKKNILDLFTDWQGGFHSDGFDFKQFGYSDEVSPRLLKHFEEKGYPYDEEDSYEMCLPKNLPQEAVLEAWSHCGLDLFDIIELSEDGRKQGSQI